MIGLWYMVISKKAKSTSHLVQKMLTVWVLR